MNFLFDTPDAAVYSGLRHLQLHCNLDAGVILYAEVKDCQFVRGKIADISEPFTFGFREFGPNIHGYLRFRLRLTTRTRVPFEPDLRRCTTTLAIIDTSGVIALDVVGVT